MPIKRLQRQAQFPCIGKLRKGAPRPESGKAPGKDLEYFRFDTDDERAAKMFEAVYGKEPDTITVYLPYATTAENFQAWQEDWLAGGLQHRCDGETCVMWLDKGVYRTDAKPCPGGCKPVGRLMVIIPELQRFAYVNCETHSQWDIMTLEENLLAVESLRGDLRGIPFILKRRPKEISTPGADGKRMRREKWLLSIEVDPAWAAVQLEQMHRAALTASTATTHMLPIADDYEDGDYAEIDVDMASIAEDTAGAMGAPVRTNGNGAKPKAKAATKAAPASADHAGLVKQANALGEAAWADWADKRVQLFEANDVDSTDKLSDDTLSKLIARASQVLRDEMAAALEGFDPAGQVELVRQASANKDGKFAVDHVNMLKDGWNIYFTHKKLGELLAE